MVRTGSCCLQRLHRPVKPLFGDIEQLPGHHHCCVLRVTCYHFKDCCLLQQHFVLAGVQACSWIRCIWSH